VKQNNPSLLNTKPAEQAAHLSAEIFLVAQLAILLSTELTLKVQEVPER